MTVNGYQLVAGTNDAVVPRIVPVCWIALILVREVSTAFIRKSHRCAEQHEPDCNDEYGAETGHPLIIADRRIYL